MLVSLCACVDKQVDPRKKWRPVDFLAAIRFAGKAAALISSGTCNFWWSGELWTMYSVVCTNYSVQTNWRSTLVE